MSIKIQREKGNVQNRRPPSTVYLIDFLSEIKFRDKPE